MASRDKWRFRNESLPGHGQGAYYGYSFRRGRWGRGVRVSVGGYGWRRPWWKPQLIRYRRHCMHMSVGPATLSIIWRGVEEL